MKKAILLAFAQVLVLTAAAQWSYRGLGGVLTYQLTIDADTVYASTSGGLFKKPLISSDTLWEQVSFPGASVLNTLFLDQQECLLLVSVDPVFHKALLYKSGNRGATAAVFLPDTVSYGYPYLAHLARSPFSEDTIYSLLHDKKTFNGGQSWQPLDAQPVSGNFIYVNPANAKEVFTGGENMIFAATLQTSDDNGQNWQFEDCSTVFAGDNALEVFHVVDGDWYAAGEGIIVKKHKDSTNWTQLLNVWSAPDWALYMFGFAFSPVNNDYMYASGDAYACDKLKLLRSSNRGASWDSISYIRPGQTRYGVYDLEVVRSGPDDRVWFGGFGVFTYDQGVPADIKDGAPLPMGLRLFPNPVSDELQLQIGGNTGGGELILEISNALGEVLLRRSCPAQGQISLPVKGWASGLYQVRLITPEYEQVVRFIKE